MLSKCRLYWAHSYYNLGIWYHCTVYTDCTQMLKVLPGIKSCRLNPTFNHRTIKKPFTSKQISWGNVPLEIFKVATQNLEFTYSLVAVATHFTSCHNYNMTRCQNYWHTLIGPFLLLQVYYSCWWGSSGTVAGKKKWLVTFGLLLIMSEPITAQKQPGGPFCSIWKEHYLGLTTSK